MESSVSSSIDFEADIGKSSLVPRRSLLPRCPREVWSPGGATRYDGLYGEAPPERGTFFRLQVYERVGILLVEVPEGMQICHLGLWKGPKGIFVIDSYLRDSAFTVVKRDAMF